VKKFQIDWMPATSARDVPLVCLWYPGIEGNAEEIEIELEHVRAADSIRVSYDFDRDGWVIKQASTFSWEADDKVCDSDWQEVAFVQAWARDKDRS